MNTKKPAGNRGTVPLVEEALQVERKKTEELLRKERETFFHILQKAPYGVILIDKDGGYVYVNREFTAVTGYTLEDVPSGRDLMRKAYPDARYREKVREAWKTDILQKGVTWVFSFVRKDREKREIEFKPTLLDDGRVIIMLSDITERKQAETILRKAREELDRRVRERTAELSRSNRLLKQEITDRKRAEKALRESEARYRSLVKQSSEGIFIFDPKTGKVLEANDQFLRMLGYREEEIPGLMVRDIVFQDKSVRAEIGRALENGQDVFGLRQYKTADGSFIDVEVGVTLINYEDQQVAMVNVRNVTERRRAEKALRESDRRYRTLFEESRDGVYLNALDGRFIDGNQSMFDLFGYTKEEMLAINARELYVNPHDRERFRKGMMKAGFVRDYEIRFRKKDGSEIDCLLTSTFWRSDDGDILGYQGIIHDITERKQAEEALRALKDELERRVAERTAELRSANERLNLELARRKRVEDMLRKGAERYRDLFQNSPMGIYRANPEGRILMANHALVRMLGFTSFTDITTNDIEEDDYEPNYLRPDFRERLERDGRVRGYEATWRRADGTEMFVNENARAIRSEEGTILYCEGTVDDITEQKKAQEQIESYQEELRSLASELSLTEERERRQIASTLHDNIGQLLAVSKMKLDGLLEGSDDRPELRDRVSEVRRFVEQAIKYTRSLTVELSPPILYELGFEAAIEWLGEQMQEQHGFRFTFQRTNESKLMDEETRIFLFTSVRELLVNIAKHAQAKNVMVSFEKQGENLVVMVADDGVGFTSVPSGAAFAGFGLFSIRERVRHLGGRFEVSSSPGHGTLLTLAVPSSMKKKHTRRG